MWSLENWRDVPPAPGPEQRILKWYCVSPMHPEIGKGREEKGNVMEKENKNNDNQVIN